jgi:hypothetical protein
MVGGVTVASRGLEVASFGSIYRSSAVSAGRSGRSASSAKIYRDIQQEWGSADLHVPGVEHWLVTEHTWIDLHPEMGWRRGR